MRIEQEQVKVQNNRTNPNIKLNIQNTTIKESAAFSSVNVATNESILINKELKTKDEIMQEAGQINLDVKKKHMAVLSQTMTYDDFKQMNEDGYKCKDQSPEEVINTLDQIKAKLLQAGVVIEGYTDTLTDSELAMAVGDENFARAINQKLERYDLPKTMENQTQVVQAMEVAQTLQPLSNPSIEYLIKNNLEPTIQNLYIAQHSNYNNRVATQNVYYSDGETSYLSKKSANVLEETSLLQIKNILEKQNIPFSEDEQENLNYMVGADLPITEENIVYFQQLKNLELPMGKQDLLEKVVVSLANGNSAMDANLCHQNYYIEEGLNNYQKLQEMSIDDIEKQKQLEEIRLKLTLDASIQMSKCNITPDTTSIKEIIRFLTEYETTRAQELFSNDVEAQEKYSIYQTNLNTIAEVKEAPISILGNDIANINRVSIQTIADWSREKENNSSVQQKLLSYETIWTSPRKDMGDSLTKAVENSDVLLEGLGIEPSKESYRALQILAENQLEITTDAINNIMEFDSKLQTVLQNLTPDQVLRLVKEGINPIQMQLDEILTFVSEPMETDVKHNILAQDRYAKALYQFDKAGSITEEEKQAYIAICKMLYQIDKSNGAVIGSMVKQEKAMTFEHFLSDIQSRKQTNKNVVIDDDFGLVIEVDRSNTVAQQIQNYYQQLLDKTLLQDEIEYLNELQLKEEYDMIKEGFTISDETINQFLQADFTPSIWEMVTYDSFLQKKSTIYQELISNTSNESSIKNQSSTLEEIFGEIEKQFTDKKSAQDAYEKMSQELNQLIDQEIITAQEEININSNQLKFYLNYQNQIQLLQQFAKKEIYEIPYQIENEWVNVSVVHKVSNEDTKNLSIDLTTKQFGSVHIGMDVLDHKISGFFTCEQNAISLELKRNKFLDVIKEQGYEITELPVVQTKEKIMISNELNSNNDQIVEEKPNSDLLYFITKEILALF